MGKVRLLDELTVNQIAAGEVIERPASVIKELVENAIDAGAKKIEIYLTNGGRSKIQVIDDGEGMEKDDALLALEPHATSKIRNYEDLSAIRTLGFRGEALPSIAAVSRLTLKTSTSTEKPGTKITVTGGEVKSVKREGMPRGTNILVEEIFFNTPARSKFLKTIPSEVNQAKEVVTSQVLGHPEISFRLCHQDMELINTIGGQNLHAAVCQIFNPTITKELIPVEGEYGPLRISGFVGRPTIAKSNRIHQYFYLNGRYFRSRLISSAAEKAYGTLLPVARFPFLLLKLELTPNLVDVNVHPSKLEVKFREEKEIYRGVLHIISDQLQNKLINTPWVTRFEPGSGSRISHTIQPKIHPEMPLWVEGTVARERSFDLTGLIREETKTREVTELPAGYLDHMTLTHVSDTTGLSPNRGQSGEEQVVSPGLPQEEISQQKVFNLFRTYLLLEEEDGLLIIDQHAAHERVLYDQLREGKHNSAQLLLTPITLEFSADQCAMALENKELLAELGFEIEEFGAQTLLLRSVPQGMPASKGQEILTDFILEWTATGKAKKSIPREEALMMIACKQAIKAGDAITAEEAMALLTALWQSEVPQTCPHGRPTMVSLSKEEIERIFKRR
ncbi:MAG TPA: DNA mismatch repair endonuclease MutL [Firmicutes bacterium]|nr:DNA mismatch repair endonuclease MutL [Bacillota bacterium]